MIGAHFVLPDEFKGKKMPGQSLTAHAGRVRPESIIVSEAELVVAASYYYKRTDVLVLEHKGELAWGLEYEESEGRSLALDDLTGLVEREAGEGRLVLVIRRDHHDRYRRELPRPLYESKFGRFSFVQY
jgi:hypothetical protein